MQHPNLMHRSHSVIGFKFFTGLGLLLLGHQPAPAVSWSTGANAGNWIALNPTTAKVGIGTSTATDPAEKLTITGGNVLIDNNRFLKGKTSGGTVSNIIGINASNSVSIYEGKVTIASNGNTLMGSASMTHANLTGNLSVIGSAQVFNGATLNGPIQLNGPVASNVLFNGRVGIGYASPQDALYVSGSTTLDGLTTAKGGTFKAEGGFFSLGDFWSKNAEINDYLKVWGNAELWGHTITNNLSVWGNLDVYGTKNFVQLHPTDETKKIVYVAAEAGEALTLARGIARTENGQATVQLPDHFALVTSEEAPLTVQLTVEGAPALVYVVSKSRQAIEVKMKASDFSEFHDVTFNYFVQGVRDGFEDHLAVQDIGQDIGADAPAALSPKRLHYMERVKKASKAGRKPAKPLAETP